VLLIIEKDVKNAVREQRDADDRHEQRDIFREQASASFGENVRRRPVLLRTV
jgi:hypothetical protein